MKYYMLISYIRTSSVYKVTANEVPPQQTAGSLYPGQLTSQPIRNHLTDQILEAQINFDHVYCIYVCPYIYIYI